mgnify:FL=1
MPNETRVEKATETEILIEIDDLTITTAIKGIKE